jgi:hypothetical protein
MSYSSTKWHIKYDPSITEADFNKFKQEMSKNGWEQREHFDGHMSYKSFASEKFIRHWFEQSKGNYWAIDNNVNGATTEKRISDFIGVGPIRKFKTGDRVRVKDTANVRHFNATKSIGQIAIVDDDRYIFDKKIYLLDGNKYGCNYVEDDLELVTEETKAIPEQYVKGEYYVANCEGPINSGSKTETYVIIYDRKLDICHQSANYYIIGPNPRISSGGGFYNIVRKATEEEKWPFFPKEKPVEPKKPAIDSWCVMVTRQNKEIVKYHTNNCGMYSIGAYYGIDKAGKYNGYSLSHKLYFDKVLTTEEFYKKIGHIEPKTEGSFEEGEIVNVFKCGYGCGSEDLGVQRIFIAERLRECKYKNHTRRVYAVFSHLDGTYKAIDTEAIRKATQEEREEFKKKELAKSYTPPQKPMEEPKTYSKFQIGDVIIGNAKANSVYGITREGWKGLVVFVSGNSIKATSLTGDPYEFPLSSQYFDLYERGTIKVGCVPYDGSTFSTASLEKAIDELYYKKDPLVSYSSVVLDLSGDLSYNKNPIILKKPKKTRLITCDF